MDELMHVANKWEDYEIIDAGGGEKLERWGISFYAALIRRSSGRFITNHNSGEMYMAITTAAPRAAGNGR